MGLRAGALNRRITIMRSQEVDDGTASVAGEPVSIGTFWASRTDVSDGERIRASSNGEEITARFIVRWTPLTRTISGKNTLVSEGRTYQVTGTKETGGRHVGIEITASARADAWA